jgi:4-amino-4-deoxy-L-arabinose transferase-like glycosyltransferase
VVVTILRSIWRATPRPLRAASVQAASRLTNPERADRTAIVLLLAFAVLWALSATVRNVSGRLHGDMLETYVDSMELRLGYSKHPPLISWITAAWFAVLPVKPWAFYLLSCLNTALGLWAVWLAAGRVVDARRRILAVALLGLLPLYTFHAASFNHNTLQLSLWPLVALTFLISIERNNAAWSVLFGATSGLALLGKYYAVWIIFGCALAALLHPARQSYFRSVRPYLAAAAGAAVFAPHVVWLLDAQFRTITRLADAVDQPPLSIASGTLQYLLACAAYLSPALLAIWVCSRPPLRVLCEGWPPMRRVVACLGLAPIVLPVILLPLAQIAVRVPWMFPALFFVPLTIVSAPHLFVSRRAVASTIGAVAVVAVLGASLSPILAIVNFMTNKPDHLEPYAALARVATELWRERAGRPLARVTGLPYETFGISFYSDDHPAFSPLSTGAQFDDSIAKDWNVGGILVVCRNDKTICADLAQRRLPTAERVDVTLAASFLWMSRPAVGYILYIQPGMRGR